MGEEGSPVPGVLSPGSVMPFPVVVSFRTVDFLAVKVVALSVVLSNERLVVVKGKNSDCDVDSVVTGVVRGTLSLFQTWRFTCLGK